MIEAADRCWECEHCGRHWPIRQLAEDCETKHLNTMEGDDEHA